MATRTLAEHIAVRDAGTIVILAPRPDAEMAWFAEHVGQPDHGPGHACDPRAARDIVAGAARDLRSWQ